MTLQVIGFLVLCPKKWKLQYFLTILLLTVTYVRHTKSSAKHLAYNKQSISVSYSYYICLSKTQVIPVWLQKKKKKELNGGKNQRLNNPHKVKDSKWTDCPKEKMGYMTEQTATMPINFPHLTTNWQSSLLGQPSILKRWSCWDIKPQCPGIEKYQTNKPACCYSQAL